MKVIISAGGTGGHIYPALAIINKIKEEDKNSEIIYVGTHNRMEKDIVPKTGIKYVGLEIYGFSKTHIMRDFKNIYLIEKAKKECLKLMEDFKPDIVIGAGGYVTYPVITAAIKKKIKTFIHEQNSIPGKCNRWLSKKTNLVGISFKNSKAYFEGAKKVVYTGNPCGDGALKAPIISKESFGLKEDKRLILVVAGSLGSASLNEKMKAFLKLTSKEDYQVLYVTGKGYYEEFTSSSLFPNNVKVVPYIENLAGIIKNCDLIITRAGATTLSEILALKKPSIIIPSPYVANNHQYYNALDLVNLHVATLIEEKNLNAEALQVAVNELMHDNKKYQEYINNLNNLNLEKSSDIIYKEIKELINE